MTQWKTLVQKECQIGTKQFVEISLKEPPYGEEQLVGISKGWVLPHSGKKRYKSNILFPRHQVGEVVHLLDTLRQEGAEQDLSGDQTFSGSSDKTT